MVRKPLSCCCQAAFLWALNLLRGHFLHRRPKPPSLPGMLQRDPIPTKPNVTRLFWWFALGQGALWFLLPALLSPNLPPDAVEGLAWGHAWPLGTHKYPPLQSWLLEIAAWLGGRTDAGIYALNAGCLVLTYWALWRLGNKLMPSSQACMGVVFMCGCIALPMVALSSSPDIVLLPLFALCGLQFWRSFTLDLWRDWLILGALAGLGLWVKYSFLLMLLSFALFIVWEREARAIVNRTKAWAAVILAVLVFLPHLNWLLENHWLPFVYARAQADRVAGEATGIVTWLRFVGLQLLIMVPVAFICWLARENRAFVWPEKTPGSRYLMVLAWAPFVQMALLALIQGGKPQVMQALALWPFLGLWGAARWGSQWTTNSDARHLVIVLMVSVPLVLANSTRFGIVPERAAFPRQTLVQQAEILWAQQGWRSPLTIVLGDNRLGGYIAWYSRTRPQLMYYGSAPYSAGVTDAMVRKQGAVVIWDIDRDGEDLPKWALRHGGVGSKITFRIVDNGRGYMVAMGVLAPQE